MHCSVRKILLVEKNLETIAPSPLFCGYLLAYSLPPIFPTDVTGLDSKAGQNTIPGAL